MHTNDVRPIKSLFRDIKNIIHIFVRPSSTTIFTEERKRSNCDPCVRQERHRHRRSAPLLGTLSVVERQRSTREEQASHPNNDQFFSIQQIITDFHLSNLFANAVFGVEDVTLQNFPFFRPFERKTNTQERQTESKLITAPLRHVMFTPKVNQDEDEKRCSICYVDFQNNEHIIHTDCCRLKFLHIKCGIQCLRKSDVCPFCKAAKISFE
jgi:hypothetical protein